MKPIDAHVHVWDPNRFSYRWLESAPDLDRPFLPPDLPYSPLDPGGAVFVQADCADHQMLAEVDWVVGLSETWPQLCGIVAAAAIERGEDVSGELEQLLERPLVKGVRRLFQDREDSFILASETIAGAKRVAEAGLTFDACIRSHQLSTLTAFAAKLPELNVVLDHMAKPPISEGRLDPWREAMRSLGKLPNVFVKISGAGAEASPERPLGVQALPFIKETLEIFGSERCMLGSDWPVSMKDHRTYSEWTEIVLDLAMIGASTAERENVTAATAHGFYGLSRD